MKFFKFSKKDEAGNVQVSFYHKLTSLVTDHGETLPVGKATLDRASNWTADPALVQVPTFETVNIKIERFDEVLLPSSDFNTWKDYLEALLADLVKLGIKSPYAVKFADMEVVD